MSRSARTAVVDAFHSLQDRFQWSADSNFKRVVTETLSKNADLGFTCFGGPAVHFQVYHKRFVEKHGWLSEPVFQELFAVTQALSGPASTKMLYCINLRRNGFLAAVSAFLLWSIPGAAGMFALALGISHISDVLPEIAYAVLSGLNAATVGIVALAAVQLSGKAITDKVSRMLVFLGATAGMLYNALWYFPVLIVIAGLITFAWDSGVPRKAGRSVLAKMPWRRRHVEIEPDTELTGGVTPGAAAEAAPSSTDQQTDRENDSDERTVPAERELTVSWKLGTIVIVAFFLTFIAVMVARAVAPTRPLLFGLFSNMYLAGTIIFGGGPVVIPLLREYIVTEGWVSPRDFLLGLAIVQSFPGPNFNFAVYLGALTASNGGYPAIAGAIIGYIGIFAPGLILVHGTMGIWKTLRSRPWVKAVLRGINAAAVGLIYTAVYRLWEIGYLDVAMTSGTSLGREPWWVVVTATSYTATAWFGMPVPVAILLGGVMGLVWYGVVKA
ncbi:chromate ion transporter [Coniochaeta sp. 2T2.1]|nr:chromate ion transporter [Coniochaeta sp. 2T2.1]